MHVRKVTVATAVAALAISGLAAGGSGPALADGRGPRATATGGSATAGNVSQQNTAQQSRQNNNCSNDNPDGRVINLTDSRLDGRCVTADGSVNHYAFVRSGDAKAKGGSGVTSVLEQNTAQLGRQNNNCSNRNFANLILTDSSLKSLCLDKDTSRNKHTRVKGGGAKAKGGAATVGDLFEQNTAQEGRQNNNCDDPSVLNFTTTGSKSKSLCANKDASRNKHTRVKGGGAKAEGGTGGGSFVDNQNTAQEGRQNNNCGHRAGTGVTATDARLTSQCTNKDRSKNHKTIVKAGGAKARSGNATGAPDNQNTAQEGRQNNNCDITNETSLDVIGGGTDTRCANKDRSKNHKTIVKSGGAKARSGNTTSSPDNQNTAQEGRQNNNCANANGAALTLTDSRKRVDCKTLDASKNVRTKEKRGAVRAEGGDSVMAPFQQNTAQTGRQSNNCGNSNNTEITATGSRSTTQCVAVDRSKNIGSSYR